MLSEETDYYHLTFGSHINSVKLQSFVTFNVSGKYICSKIYLQIQGTKLVYALLVYALLFTFAFKMTVNNKYISCLLLLSLKRFWTALQCHLPLRKNRACTNQ